MKEIKAFIRLNKVNEIITQLKNAGFVNIAISAVEGTGNLQDENAFVSQKFSVTDSEIVKLEMVVKKSEIETIVRIISEYGKTLYTASDGIIYVSEIENIYHVKTGLNMEEE